MVYSRAGIFRGIAPESKRIYIRHAHATLTIRLSDRGRKPRSVRGVLETSELKAIGFGAMARKKKPKVPARDKIARELYRTHGREIPHADLVAFLGVDPLPKPVNITVTIRVLPFDQG